MSKAKVHRNVDVSAVVAANICISLSLRSLGTRARVDPGEVEESEAQELLHVSKDIFDRKAIAPIVGLLARARAHVRDTRAIPVPILRGGVYMLPVMLMDEVNTYLTDTNAQVQQLAKLFARNDYQAACDEAKARLQPAGLWSADEYPAASRVERAFGVRWNFFSFDVPARVKEISSAIYAKEQAKIKAELEGVKEEAIGILRAQCCGFVQQLVNMLATGDEITGAKKAIRTRFTARAVGKLEEFLATFPFRNMFGDDLLQQQVARLRDLLAGVDVTELKTSEDLRLNMERSMIKVQEELSKLVVAAPVRRFKFNREDAA